jgi:hypothetical protein
MNQPELSIKQLYPNRSEPELREAEENITAYLALVLRIYTRLEQDGKLPALTDEKTLLTMQAKVDSKQP